MKFHENPSSGRRLCSMRTDRHEADSRFPQFCERAPKMKTITYTSLKIAPPKTLSEMNPETQTGTQNFNFDYRPQDL